MHFQLPSACFFQISTIFPRSVVRFPSPRRRSTRTGHRDTPNRRCDSTFIGCHEIVSPDSPSNPLTDFLMLSLSVAITSFGGSTAASSVERQERERE
jgi:hypothetical protein